MTPEYIVYDRKVEGFALGFAAGRPSVRATLPIDVSESAKTLDTVAAICRFLLDAGADRDALLIAVGGGVTTDVTGLAAALYKRGVRYANVPTTLLAQVDAATGGKNGVNLDGFKNVLGTFLEPEFTLITAEPLETLPARELRSGAAELLKTFIIKDKGNYARAVETLSAMNRDAADVRMLEPLVLDAVRIKKEIVASDPRDRGARKALNLGHTFAHAIEWCQSAQTGPQLSHGECVAIGIIMAAELSVSRGLASADLPERLRRDFVACGLPVDCPFPAGRLEPAILRDKKNRDGHIGYVLLKDIGEVVI